MSELCAAFAISRKTGYKWLQRYGREGPAGLEDRSRARHRHGRRMAPEIAEAILALRRARPHWGPRKLRVLLQSRNPEVSWPAPKPINKIEAAGWGEGWNRPRISTLYDVALASASSLMALVR